MKNTPSPTLPAPRLVCRVVRQWCSLVESANPAHTASCAECRDYFRAGVALDAALRSSAAPIARAQADEDDVRTRAIMRAVRSAAPATERSPSWRGALATGAAMAALSVAMVYFHRGPEISAPVAVTPPPPTADAALLADTVQDLSGKFVDSVIPTAGAMVANNPMQQEFGSIYADARAALGFLALNFLPTAPENNNAALPAKNRI